MDPSAVIPFSSPVPAGLSEGTDEHRASIIGAYYTRVIRNCQDGSEQNGVFFWNFFRRIEQKGRDGKQNRSGIYHPGRFLMVLFFIWQKFNDTFCLAIEYFTKFFKGIQGDTFISF